MSTFFYTSQALRSTDLWTCAEVLEHPNLQPASMSGLKSGVDAWLLDRSTCESQVSKNDRIVIVNSRPKNKWHIVTAGTASLHSHSMQALEPMLALSTGDPHNGTSEGGMMARQLRYSFLVMLVMLAPNQCEPSV